MLSAVERGQKSPTIRVLSHVAEALGTSISELLTEPAPDQLRVVRAASRKRITDPESGVERVALGDVVSPPGIDLVLYRLPAHSDTGAFAPHRRGVVEHVVVIRGAADIDVGESIVRLATDDSMTYAANAAHRYRNPTEGVTELILVIDASNVVSDPRR